MDYSTGLGIKGCPRACEFCSSWCFPHLPGSACSIHATCLLALYVRLGSLSAYASKPPPSCRHAEFQVALSLPPSDGGGSRYCFCTIPAERGSEGKGRSESRSPSFYPVKDSLFNMAMTFWGREVGKKNFVLEQRL